MSDPKPVFKPGWKTTEFAFLVVFSVLSLLGVLAGQLDNPVLGSIAVAVVGAAYAIARGLAKAQGVAERSISDGAPK